ncbi:MAG: glycosyl transferase [Candidatus Tectimicrobiota bacterium]|nr:MAG: glycosyl transferase [Candidatus Tectomicrobia bacterium]
MAKRVLMLLANGFDPDPRVHREARSLVEAGYEVTLLAWDRHGRARRVETVDGIRVERLAIASSYGRGTSQLPCLLRFWRQLVRTARQRAWDVVHCHDFDTLPPGWLLAKWRRKPVIFDAHESYHEMLAANVSPLIKKIIAVSERWLVKRVDLLITVGRLLEAEYRRRGARHTCVVGNWKALEDFQVPPAEVARTRQALGIDPQRLVVAYLGFFEPDRGLFELIAAVKSEPAVHLLLGGKGTLEERVRQAAEGCRNISFLGYVAPHLIPRYTAAADVVYYCLSGDYGNNKYSAPNKLFEALAAGRAVLTGRVGEIARIVAEEQCGVCLPEVTAASVRQALRGLQDRTRLAAYQHRAYLAARRTYNWQQAEEVLLKAYDRLLAASPASVSRALCR